MAVSSQTTTYLMSALAGGLGNATEITNILNNSSVANGLTALAGGGQAGATALVTGTNRVTTCATAGDSVVLPSAVAGRSVSVVNVGAATLAVFPNGAADVIQGIAAATAMACAAGAEVNFTCAVAGTWSVLANTLLDSSWSTGALQSTTFPAGALTGGGDTIYTNTGTTPASLTTRTATQMFNDTPNAQVGMTYVLTIINLSGSANTATLVAGSGVTITGTATIAQNIARVYQVTFNTATTLTMQEMYSFTAAA